MNNILFRLLDVLDNMVARIHRFFSEERLARAMNDDYKTQLYWSSMEIIASEGLEIPKFPECPKCACRWVEADTETESCKCKICSQQWSDRYTLVEEPEETDKLHDDLGYPSADAQNSNARYIPEYDYIRIFGTAPGPNSYYEPVCFPDSQKYMSDENEDGDPAGDSVQALNELINDEKGLEDFGENAYWVPKCNLK